MQRIKLKSKAFFKRRIADPILKFLSMGVSPKKLALAVALGCTVATFPVFGSTTILCAGLALIFRLNMPAIQMVNYLCYPLQFLFYIPFIRYGEWLFNASASKISVGMVFTLIKTDVIQAIQVLWTTTLHAMIAWLTIGPLAALLIYFILYPVFSKISGRRKPAIEVI